jgi:hypothetical protein
MIKPLWWVPIIMCVIAGIVFLLPAGNTGPTLLPYDSVVPLAPISTILIWIVGYLVYLLARWATSRPMRPQ